MLKRVLFWCLAMALAEVAAAQTRLLMIIEDFPQSIPTDAQFRQYMVNDAAEVDQFTSIENSYGFFTQVTDVIGPFVVDPTGILAAGNLTAGIWEIAKAGQLAALANGVDLTPYGGGVAVPTPCHCVYLFPQPSEFGASYSIAGYGSGLGVFRGGAFGRTWPPGFQLLAHEEGHHLFQLNHAHAMGCSDGSPGLTCERGVSSIYYEYGDNYDLMGQGQGQFNNAIKAALGWLDLVPLNVNGDYLLAPLELPDGARGYTFSCGRKGMLTCVLEYRQPIAHDAVQPWADPGNVFNGVLVRFLQQNAASPGGYDTALIRMNRDAPDVYGHTREFNQAALTVGQTYCDKEVRRGITVLNTSLSGALIRVDRCR